MIILKLNCTNVLLTLESPLSKVWHIRTGTRESKTITFYF